MRRPLLLPLVPLYAAGLALREMRLERGWEKIRRLQWPVISVGNLSAGGSGKTPLVIALARSLTARGFQVDVLSRGYGRTSREAVRVRVDGGAEEFGDEPLLIAREAGVPVYVAAERFEAGSLAEANADESEGRPRAHILDDGFQHRQLGRDVDVLLVNREDLHDSLLPAGNLREPLTGFSRATVLAIPENEPEVVQFFTDTVPIDRNSEESRWIGPMWRIRRRMEVPHVEGPVAAFCGVARPEQFFAGLEAAGVQIAAKKAFADHRRYTVGDLNELAAMARAAGAMALITTEKDRVRIGNMGAEIANALPLITVPLTTVMEDEEQVLEWLTRTLASSRSLASL